MDIYIKLEGEFCCDKGNGCSGRGEERVARVVGAVGEGRDAGRLGSRGVRQGELPSPLT